MARCSNCQAPLPEGRLTCAYCGVRNDLDLQGIHYNTTHEPETPRTCPRCDCRLTGIDLRLNGRFLLDRCDRCFGIFFDNGELEGLLRASVSNVFQVDRTLLDSINNARPPEEYPVAYIRCPVCGQLMNRVNFGARSGVIVDRCKAHGVWLDGGELRRLMEWTKLGGAQLEQERQAEQRREEERRLRQAQGEREPAFLNDPGNMLQYAEPELFTLICRTIRSLLS